ncbi:spartin [Holotrichia oblita]|uniref:Spartin n=1 Tax=Holotrichia oblita TaxID=644536 RepID=A0ACB9SYT1_HOLOL|nr:spartin [Holotrichia oblita]
MESSNSEWANTFDNIKNIHDVAYRSIEKAITLEENEKPFEALDKYKEGVDLIDQALSLRVSCPNEPDPTWDKACILIQKLKRTRGEVLTRINSLKLKYDPPQYSNTDVANSQSSSSESSITYRELALALRDVSVRDFRNSDISIIYINEQAKLYYISPDGTVLSTSEYQELKIFGIDGDVPNIFLQVGSWIYPLIPGVSPCYKTEYNGFIFPDIHSHIEGTSVGLIVPGDADEFLYELLTNILHGVQREQERPPPPPAVSDTISSGIVAGAGYLARGLVSGAENIGRLLNYGTPKVIKSINPAKEPTPVPNAVSQSLKFTENATSKTAQVTEYVAEKVGIATSKLGQFLAPHIQKQGTRLLQSGFNYSEEEASTKLKGVLSVAAGAVEGFSTIYHGLEKSASILGNNLKDNTVKIVAHKYGSPVGDVTMDTLNTVGNVVVISHTAGTLKPKGLLKKAAKDTGKALATNPK